MQSGGRGDVMCGKRGKVFYKMGNLGDRSSTWCLGFGSVLENSWSCRPVCLSGVTAERMGVNVCINSFLIMYHHFCDCVLLLRLLHPFIDRVLSGVQNNNCCCRGKYVSVEHTLNTQRTVFIT